MKTLIALLIFTTSLFASYEELLFNGNCITCHKIKEAKSAPSISEIQMRYKSAFSSKDEFVKYMSNWVLKPTVQGSIMHDSIEKHGLMPELGYHKEVVQKIATYIYETDFSKQP